MSIVAGALLSSCARESGPNELHTSAEAPAARVSDIYVDMDAGVVTVRAHDAPLQAVIERLAERAGLHLSMQEGLDERVTVELHSLTLTAALKELLRGRSFILAGPRLDSRGTLWIISRAGHGRSVGPIANALESAGREELRTFDELSVALSDHDSNVRLDAVSELGRFGDEPSATMLANSASHDDHPFVRAEALHVIGGARADKHSPVFMRALTDRDASVRKAAISALENIGAENSLQTLAIALKDRDASVRATAVDAIGEIGGEAARPLLESALADESAVVREAATEQLGNVTPTFQTR